ncbi:MULTISPECIES: hypothetical protein [Mycolicibacterium]|uniref:hypothetical protein n=1 Tax=Mycolicibacterium TaxID=1866885 RepID=UPI00059D57B2|nr:hypothetical protein [Mycolicibacterium vanbaalenii]MCV7128280.1 hypothetical protein [Mycolicibacterium vanbaalenii PYR-1]UJL28258.1 hypothetical protein HZU38_26000 [Mycolicibacterium vanbaalenii]WND54951.1 hypothetical protein QQA43_19585 [Mycolicibacterium vanbaalenii]
MGRNLGRVGGATAGIVAIVFGILDLIDTVNPWILIGLGTVAVIGVLADFLRQPHGDDSGGAAIKQTQKTGDRSTSNQAGRDIVINAKPSDRG